MSEIIPLAEILMPADRQRKLFDEQELADLRTSICTEKGLLCPVFVRPNTEGDPDNGDERYVLVAGERRYRAISSLEQPYMHGDLEVQPGYIPAIVRSFTSEIEIMEAELHENVMRAQLTWQEKMAAIAALHELKKAQDPRHTAGMTAHLIDQGERSKAGGYYSGAAKDNVDRALLLKNYLHDPEVANAKTARDAERIVSRRLEDEALARMRRQQEAMAAAAEAARAAPGARAGTTAGAGVPNADGGAGGASGAEAAGAGGEQGATKAGSPGLMGLQGVLDFLPSPTSTSKHQLLEGDMRERIREIPDGSIHVVITDPPYGVGVSEFGDFGRASLGHEYSEEGFVELHEILVSQIDRVCAPSAHVYIFCDPFVPVPGYSFDERGEPIQNPGMDIWWKQLVDLFPSPWRVRRKPLVWHKGTAGSLADGTAQGYRSSHEYILYATRGGRPCSGLISDVMLVPPVRSGKVHAAQKPVELYKKLLAQSAAPGDTVLDAFAGSGTIFRAVQDSMYTAIGIEQKEKFIYYCQEAMKGKPLTEDDEAF